VADVGEEKALLTVMLVASLSEEELVELRRSPIPDPCVPRHPSSCSISSSPSSSSLSCRRPYHCHLHMDIFQ
jgi:hypothetical protein